jgi:hypothetical protein
MCQKCGKPFANGTESESGQKRVGREQQELPAWLESLRASERPVTSSNMSPNLHIDNFADEGSLSSWMRAQQNDAVNNTPSHQHVPLRPSWASAPNTDEGMFAKGIPARSLIDEQTFPQWLQQDKQASTPQSRLEASSLVQPDAIPAWLKAIQPQPAVIQPSVQDVTPPLQPPVTPPADLPARNLIDQSSLPAWLSGQEAGNSTNSERMGAPEQGVSASSLLDMNAMPRWLQEISKKHRGEGQTKLNGAIADGRLQEINDGQQGEGMTPANSLIERNSLPAWLREGNEQQQMGALAPQQEAAASMRVENMHVPNRPRNGRGSNEGSKVAAHAFASMLGVAPTLAPFPTSQPDAQVAQRDVANAAAEQAAPPQEFIGQQLQERYQSPQPLQPQVPTQGYGPSFNSGYPLGQPTQAALQGGNNSAVPMQATDTQKPAAKPAKRGFFEFFRSWFSR